MASNIMNAILPLSYLEKEASEFCFAIKKPLGIPIFFGQVYDWWWLVRMWAKSLLNGIYVGDYFVVMLINNLSMWYPWKLNVEKSMSNLKVMTIDKSLVTSHAHQTLTLILTLTLDAWPPNTASNKRILPLSYLEKDASEFYFCNQKALWDSDIFLARFMMVVIGEDVGKGFVKWHLWWVIILLPCCLIDNSSNAASLKIERGKVNVKFEFEGHDITQHCFEQTHLHIDLSQPHSHIPLSVQARYS